MPFLIPLVALAVLAGVAAAIKQNRRQLLARIRAEWGNPRNRVRRMDAIRASHRSRLAAIGSSASLDDRTWNDLNLDDVFAAVDRTASTLGQHALYHRLRSAPLADNLDSFEALVRRLAVDVPARERAQMALARLQDPHGYDLWWLAQSDAVDAPFWHVIFPLLTVSATIGLLVGGVWLHLIPLAVVAIGVNVVVNFATVHRVGSAATAFRQVAPLIATAQSLLFLKGEDINPIVGAIQIEMPHVVRLKTIARW